MILTPNGHVGGVVQAPLHPVGRDRVCKTFITRLSLQQIMIWGSPVDCGNELF
jgi:hypothetical protein